MSDYLDPNNEELLKDFFLEAESMVESLEQNILVLENDPSNSDAIDEIFRAAHTLKGSSATVQMDELAGFTHVVEDTLDEIRSGSITVHENMVDLLLNSIDIVKEMLSSRADGGVYSGDTSQVIEGLKALSSGQQPEKPSILKRAEAERSAAKTAQGKQAKPIENSSPALSEFDVMELMEVAEGVPVFSVKVIFDEENPMNTVGGIQVFAALKEVGSVLKTQPDFEKLYEDNFFPEVIYYLASNSGMGQIQSKLDMPDVITRVSVESLEAVETISKEADHSKSQVRQPQTEDAVDNSLSGISKQIAEAKLGQAEQIESLDELEKKRSNEIKKSGGTGSVLRVDSKRIDNLLNLVSETVINKATFNQISNQFTEVQVDLQNTELTFKETLREMFDSLPEYLVSIQDGRSVKEIRKEINERFGHLFNLFDPFSGGLKGAIGKFRNTSQNLGRITTELHERVLQIRMVPIAQIFSRFPRLVRDVSKSLNKKVNLIVQGEDTELDKSVIEDLLDPLIHCVRNSVDHGIELPEDREAAGKDPDGTVILSARNEGNMIVIDVSDDGKGIDINRIKEKAVERGIIHPSKTLTDLEAFNLIFDPGFSTAREITNISGRGVGLDVVKKQIEKLNGSVSVWSEMGRGTKMTIKLPLTLAIIQGLLVRVGEEIYAIPITSVLESHRIRPAEIKMIDNYEVFNLREDVVSLLRLNRLFRLENTQKGEYHFVVIVGSGDKKVGLMVDSLIGEEDVVIKPLRDRYTNSPGIAGATILGDGTVSLIIDVSQLLELGVKKEIESRSFNTV
jgi:two-component system chemotaxis sensor kinase CheA